MIRKMDSRGITNQILLEIDRRLVFRVGGPYQNEQQKEASVNHSVMWFRNDFAMSVFISDYEEQVHTATINVMGFRMIDDPNSEWMSPFGVGWKPIAIPGNEHDHGSDCNIFGAVLRAQKLALALR